MSTLADKLLQASLVSPGPLRLQSQLCKLSKEKPEWSLDQKINVLMERVETCSQADRNRLKESGIQAITVLDEGFPQTLRNLQDPPLVLYYCGNPANLHRLGLAVVGARACTTYGRQMARWLAGEMARLGISIVSGLALGIDAQAHAAALQVGGITVAVLGCGLDRIYPRAHTRLARDIVRQGGTVITEFPPGTPPKPHHFPIRNRLIAGLSRITLIVEAKTWSGSLTTARHALEQGRSVFAVPGPLNRPTAQGPHQLIADGEAQILTGLRDLYRELAPELMQAQGLQEILNRKIPDELARKIYGVLDPFEPTPLDFLVQELKTDVGSILSALMSLEFDRLAESVGGPAFLRNPLSPTQEYTQ